MSLLRIAAAVAATAIASGAQASIVIGAGGQVYTQNFDTLATTGSSVTWANDSTLAGWSLFRQPAPGTAITSYAVNDGSSNTGSFYSYGTGTSSDRALGGLGSGGSYFGSPGNPAVAGWIAASFTNTAASALNGFAVQFDGEQWRNGGNATAQSMVLEYGFGSSFGSVATWSAAGSAFNWTSVVNTTTAAAVNGNSAGRVANVGGSITTPWASGATLWLRWIENNDSGNDHGLAIDNFKLTAGSEVAAVPVPPSAALMAAGLGVVALVVVRRRRVG